MAWAELQHRGSIRQKYLKDLEKPIAAELARCLHPFVHEQEIRPYGAFVCRELPPLEHLGRLLPTGSLALEELRSLADGRNSFILAVNGEPPRLLVLHGRVDTDQDYASRALWIEGLILASDERGVVRIVTESSVTLIEGRRWIAKDLVFEAAEDIVQVVPVARPEIVRRLLEICHHRISPEKVGATMLCLLDPGDRPGTGRDAGIRLDHVGLSVMREADEPLILHQLRYRDGALLIGADGQLLAVNVILHPSRASECVLPVIGGTRHLSAARHTYDCPDVIAFVVSADGPVTVFSDGKRIADLKMGDPQPPPDHATCHVDSVDRSCPHCGVLVAVRTIVVNGHDTRREVSCPACRGVVTEPFAWHTEIFLRKTAQTIEALRALRARPPT
jgi:DNA integrity scanning protein DisA with diadenylate cyclase activity